MRPVDGMKNIKESKKEFFLSNGELLLRKQIEFWGERAFPIRIFSVQELRKSIQIVHDSIVDGYRMGHGCIDGRFIMVDLSTRFSLPSSLICQIAVQANISHRNVLRILGCCLETQYPVPIFESISDDGRTLSDHLRLCQRNAEHLRWSDRMRIAAEVADALNYLHTHSSMPIIHRGVGPENILLDDRLTAKLTGFHWSRPMPAVRREGFETFVRPLLGSDDEKTDVYDLGIVMLLLLTGQESRESLCHGRPMDFIEAILFRLREMGCYVEIPFQKEEGKMQAFLICEGKTEQVEAFCELTLKCTDREKESQPSTEEVVQALKQIKNM